MKSKRISRTIKDSLHLIEDFKRKEKSFINDEDKEHFEKYVSNHENAVGLKNEISVLKDDLKLKEKEIVKTIKKLSKSKKIAQKALKRTKKVLKPGTPELQVDKPLTAKKASLRKKRDKSKKTNETKVTQ
ncbi:MAG: hypothetical protein JW830_07110 [Bacteroidales bacterium]|nr:hypothetical protein [Bacteroidales bacterium]